MPFDVPRITFRILDGGLSSGTTAPPDGPMWLLGMANSGQLTPYPTSQPTELKSEFSHGPGVEGSLYALNNELDQITFLRVDPTDATAGAYGSITVSSQGAGITVTGDGTVKPGDDWNPLVEWTVGGTIGVSGIKYRYSLDGGNKVSGERELGTDTSITLPHGGGKYNLVGLELTTLLARLVEVRAEVLDHVALVGSVHGSADAGPYTITAPVDDASALLCCTDLQTVSLAHVVKVSGAPPIHGAADTTASTALTALTAPSDRAEAIVFIEEFVEIFFGDGSTVNSGHTLRTASSVHGAVDSTNVLTTDPAVAGDVVAGDSFTLLTSAPRWSIDKLVESIELVKNSTLPCNGVLEIVGNVLTNSEAQAIEDALEGLGEKYRDVRAVGHWRARNIGESLQAYAAAFALAHPEASASGRQGRLTLTAWYYPPSQLVTGGATARPYAFAAAPRLARTELATNAISEVDFGSVKGALRASDDTVLPRGVDESFAAVCTPVRLWAPRSDPDGILASRPVTLAPDGSDFALIHYGRVIDAVKKSAYLSLKKRMGQKVAPKPGTVLVDPAEAKRVQDAETKKLDQQFVKTGQADGVRVVFELTSVVSGSGTKLAKFKIFVRPVGYIEDIAVDLQFSLA